MFILPPKTKKIAGTVRGHWSRLKVNSPLLSVIEHSASTENLERIVPPSLSPAISKGIMSAATTLSPEAAKATGAHDGVAASKERTEDPDFRVQWNKDDPESPFNFTPRRKVSILMQMGLLALVGSFGASVPAPAESYVAAYLDISVETTVLVVALFVLGFALGPVIWAPVGEVYGRKVSMLPAVFVLGLFSIGSATSTTAAALFITRFFGGLFASAPISNVAAAIGDFYTPKERGFPMALYAVCVAGGPCLAPIVGSAIAVNPHLGWRWTCYIEAIIAFASVAITFFGLPETYHPVLLKKRAQNLRAQTHDERYWHPHESERIDLQNILTKYISRPLRMLFTEPMCASIAVYASFLYGLIFFLLEAIPLVFYEQRGYSLVVSTLPFLGPVVGVLCAFWINVANQPLYIKAVEKNKNRPVPEARLPPMLVGGVLFSAGVFWFGWTAAPKYSWALPTVAAGQYLRCRNFDIVSPRSRSPFIFTNSMFCTH